VKNQHERSFFPRGQGLWYVKQILPLLATDTQPQLLLLCANLSTPLPSSIERARSQRHEEY
jgi:hypothetical protein